MSKAKKEKLIGKYVIEFRVPYDTKACKEILKFIFKHKKYMQDLFYMHYVE